MKKISIIILGIIFILGLALGISFYLKIYSSNTVKDGYIYIKSKSNFNDVISQLTPFLKNKNSFIWVANKKKYPNLIKAGKYKIEKGNNNNNLVNLLRIGKQTPVKLSFNNQNTLEDLAKRIAEQIEADSLSLIKAFKDSDFLKTAGFTPKTSLAMYLPNTYEFYWNTSAKKFRQKMLEEYNRFWNKSRIKKAKTLNLSKNEVITLASIVQKETATVSERPMVAQLYLNRLNSKWPLQADPTVIFALQQKLGKNTPIKRVLEKDLKIKSPYNTYINIGLPPGPIAMPDISSIKAVLNPKKHNYYFMCASTKNPATHVFAKTLRQHNKNAAKYHQWLNKQGINR